VVVGGPAGLVGLWVPAWLPGSDGLWASAWLPGSAGLPGCVTVAQVVSVGKTLV
jgi:hypothetical protein